MVLHNTDGRLEAHTVTCLRCIHLSLLQVLTGHDKGILSLDWCKEDPDLLFSCGKDCRTLAWNPSTGEMVGEVRTPMVHGLTKVWLRLTADRLRRPWLYENSYPPRPTGPSTSPPAHATQATSLLPPLTARSTSHPSSPRPALRSQPQPRNQHRLTTRQTSSALETSAAWLPRSTQASPSSSRPDG